MQGPPSGKPGLFLDRDGVINEDRGYVHKSSDFKFLPGIFELCRAACAAGFDIFVITNQSGIARGLYMLEDFERLTAWMLARFRAENVTIAHVYFCPFHPHASVPRFRKDAECRKPKPGMILQARNEFGTDLARSVLLGDREIDAEAGRRAGVGTILVLSDAPASAGTTRIGSLLQAIPLIVAAAL